MEDHPETFRVSPRQDRQGDRAGPGLPPAHALSRPRGLGGGRLPDLHRPHQRDQPLDPYTLWFHDGTFYLIGRCHLKKCVLVFAVNRIRSIEATGDTCIQPADFDAERFMETSFGVFQGEPAKVKILFAPDAAGYVLEKTCHPSQKVATRKDGSVLFEAEVAGTREIKLWVLRWGAKAQVLAPQSLQEEIRIEAAEMLAHYTDDVRRVELSLAG